MEHEFWHQRWARREIGFHEGVPNHLLTRYFGALGLPPGARVFVPLCGKSRDMGWLLAQGHRVAGAELSQVAVEEFFAELGLVPEISAVGPLLRYAVPDLDIYQGDIFDLTPAVLGPVAAMQDRAALVALPPEMRGRYAAHVTDLTRHAPCLLTCFEYDQSLMRGPPFSVEAAEVAHLYGTAYEVTLLQRDDLPRGLRGRPAQDALWLLQPKVRQGHIPASHPPEKPL